MILPYIPPSPAPIIKQTWEHLFLIRIAIFNRRKAQTDLEICDTKTSSLWRLCFPPICLIWDYQPRIRAFNNWNRCICSEAVVRKIPSRTSHQRFYDTTAGGWNNESLKRTLSENRNQIISWRAEIVKDMLNKSLSRKHEVFFTPSLVSQGSFWKKPNLEYWKIFLRKQRSVFKHNFSLNEILLE